METFKLDSTSYVPLYQQLKEYIVGNIEKGIWKPEDKIHSENQLFEMFHVSRNTAKKAIEDLEQMGILYRVQGKGTFVSKPKIEQSLSGFYSFSKVLKEKDLNPKDIILNIKIEKTTQKVANALQVHPGEDIVTLKRLRCANEEPIILETSYLLIGQVKEIDKLKQVGNIPLYDVLRNEFGIHVSTAKESFEPIIIREDEGRCLKAKIGSPALFLERIAYDENKCPVEYCTSVVRGDRCKFYTELL